MSFFLIELPDSILETIFLYCDDKHTFSTLCRKCYQIYQSPIVRARSLLMNYSPEDVFSEKVSRKYSFMYNEKVVKAIQFQHPKTQVIQCNFFLFRWAAENNRLEFLKWLVREAEELTQLKEKKESLRYDKEQIEKKELSQLKEGLASILEVSLIEASRNGFLDMLKWLIEVRNVDFYNRQGLALTMAINGRQIASLSYLLGIGMEPSPAQNGLLLSSFKDLMATAITSVDSNSKAIFQALAQVNEQDQEDDILRRWQVIEYMVNCNPKWKGLAAAYASAQGLTGVTERLSKLGLSTK